ncbi:MAG: hypothetical protein D6782_06685 [Alphaproteobacteria bacterium]|nr:MAG: hypothetical protein D6782_06685 [Alphaproteobacteria bacterium]
MVNAAFGPPVYWPQQPDVPVYHNRAIWPFVTAYALRAAAQAGNADAVDHAIASLMRGAALNLSNMENLEWLTGRPHYDDGPVINSRRQLWSVAGYMGMVVETIFGWHVEDGGIRIAPFLTARTRAMFGQPATARLRGLSHLGRRIDIELRLPVAAAAGTYYPVARVMLDGQPVSGGAVTLDRLHAGTNVITVDFGAARSSNGAISTVPAVSSLSHDDPRVFSPRTPRIATIGRNGTTISLRIAPASGNGALAHIVYRDGIAMATLAPGVSAWQGPAGVPDSHSVCFTLVAVHTVTGLRSHPSLPACSRGSLAQTVDMDDPRIAGSAPLTAVDGIAVPVRLLSAPANIVVDRIHIPVSGRYAIATLYNNHTHALNTGVTNAVKRLVLTGADGWRHEAVIQMPHVQPDGASHPLRASTRAYADLAPGDYRLELSDYFNMSALAANATYGGPGGQAGYVNAATIAAIRIDRVATKGAEDATRPPR